MKWILKILKTNYSNRCIATTVLLKLLEQCMEKLQSNGQTKYEISHLGRVRKVRHKFLSANGKQNSGCSAICQKSSGFSSHFLLFNWHVECNRKVSTIEAWQLHFHFCVNQSLFGFWSYKMMILDKMAEYKKISEDEHLFT